MDEFNKIITDLSVDLQTTFPELNEKIDNLNKEECYKHCILIYPPLMFDIIYKRMSLFDNEFFILPEIDLSPLMKSNISENTRNIIWKYLLLILGTTSTNNKHMKPDEKKDLLNKLTESLKDEKKDPAEEFQEKIQNLMSGKIGSIAKEMAEETTGDNPEDFMKNLFQDPSKMMNMAKDIESKIEGKFKNGDINKDDIQSEAMSIMETMKDIPGLQEMMEKMGLNDQKKKTKTKRKQQRKKK